MPNRRDTDPVRPQQNALVALDTYPTLERGIFQVPGHFSPSADTSITYAVLGSRELECIELNRRFEILSPLAIRALNAILLLQHSRDTWVTSKGMLSGPYSPSLDASVHAAAFSRGCEYLDRLRMQTDEQGEFIVRSTRGSGRQPNSQLHHEIAIVEGRTSDQLRFVNDNKDAFLESIDQIYNRQADQNTLY